MRARKVEHELFLGRARSAGGALQRRQDASAGADVGEMDADEECEGKKGAYAMLTRVGLAARRPGRGDAGFWDGREREGMTWHMH